MVKGKVTWYNDADGIGFLQQENGEYVYCHFSAIIGQGLKRLAEGDSVVFDVVKGPRGLEAEHVIRT